MSDYRLAPAMRFFFLLTGGVIWLGIGLTGWATTSWVLYIPAVFFLFAAATGLCPGIIVSNRLFGSRDK